MAVTDRLIDKLALVRLADSLDAGEWANRIERISTVTRLEVGYGGTGAVAVPNVADLGDAARVHKARY